MTEALRIVLVGIGGFGNYYVSELLDSPRQEKFAIAAVVDPQPGACGRIAELTGRGVAVHGSLQEFYDGGGEADLAVLCVPIHLHRPLTLRALQQGSHVLCEKPLCATPAEAAEMAEAQRASGKQVAIGFQWSYSEAIAALTADIASGVLGRAKRLKSLVLWPRDMSYYRRNSWAGAMKDAGGNWVLDSPANNAAAHYLHNMFFVLGGEPAAARAELFRYYTIGNFDTAAVRCETRDGVEIFFVTSHAVREKLGPIFRFEFERAEVTFADGGTIVARFHDGKAKDYGSPDAQRMAPLWRTLDAVREGKRGVCGIREATAHVQCIAMMQKAGIEAIDFGCDEMLKECYEQWRLPGEMK